MDINKFLNIRMFMSTSFFISLFFIKAMANSNSKKMKLDIPYNYKVYKY